MNNIPHIQNEPAQLHRLAAQRQLYASAKNTLLLQVLLSGFLPVLTALLAIATPSARPYFAAWGVLTVLADILWLNERQKSLRESGAKAQEAFDCEVLQMKWNTVKAGAMLDPEFVKEQSDRYEKWAAQMPSLRDWYPPDLGGLPIHVARIACQRTNCWWDGKQRRNYARLLLTFIVVAILLIAVAAIFSSIKYSDLVLGVLLPLAPLIVLGIRLYVEHTAAADRLDKLKDHANALWQRALAGESASKLTTGSRAVQDEIFDGRKRNPLIFDRLFRRLRNSYEGQMTFGAGEMIAEAKVKLRLPAGSEPS